MKGKMLIRGISGNAGIAVGTVKVVNGNKEKIMSIKQGDILVAEKIEDLTLDPYYSKASAFVQDVGGSTNHGNILAKTSLHIPSVSGTIGISQEKATEVLHDGQKVVVDGLAGYEEVTDKSGKKVQRPYGAIFEWLPDVPGTAAPKVGPMPTSAPAPSAAAAGKPSLADLMKKYNIKPK